MDCVIGNSRRVAISYNQKLMGVNDFSIPFSVQDKTWRGLAFIYKDAIWSDGEHIYYSGFGTYPGVDRQKVLDLSTNTWIDKEWTVYNDNPSTGRINQPVGSSIWTDGETFYMSDGINGNQLVLDKSTSSWYTKEWYGLDKLILNAADIWSDGENIYLSHGLDQYVLDKATSTWQAKTWSGFSYILGNYVWTDGTDIFYSEGSYQYVLNKSTSTWVSKSWGTVKPDARYIWKCGDDYYCTYGNSAYKLNSSHNGWTSVRFRGSGAYRIDGRNVWSDGTKCYYSYAYEQYEFNPSNSLSWDVKYWNGMDVLHGNDVWTDGEHVYYSTEISAMEIVHLVLDKSTSTWFRKTFNGTQLSGHNVWYNGTNVYWSYGNSTKQYVFDKTASQWRAKTWYGLPSNYQIYKHNLWRDPTNICYGDYVLDPSTSTWTERPMTGFPSTEEVFEGRFIWNDGINVYYSEKETTRNTQLSLDLTTMNWSEKEWGGVPELRGYLVWNYEGNTYYLGTTSMHPTGQFVLGSTWYPINIGIEFLPNQVWTDGDNYYIDEKYVLTSINT